MAGDVDALCALVTLDEIAATWHHYHADTIRNEGDFWAVESQWMPWSTDQRRQLKSISR